jgi:GH15 family glucan-1,4-alpha-glucosidase
LAWPHESKTMRYFRYCWIRDATFSLYALIVGGYREEARAWREWLVKAVADTPTAVFRSAEQGGKAGT